jgi:1-deoxy-D-xylulose-5-phosphate synthase
MDSSSLSNQRLLDSIHLPQDLKKFNLQELTQISQEIREEVISTISQIGGHLGAGLGVVELTVALHYAFNTPKDLIIWDTGHQSYPHKILTGRKSQLSTIRQPGGISGFTKRTESIYDVFGAGHSSTSISAALGMAIGRDLNNEKKDIITVIGDGAISAGIAYEAMNNAAISNSRLVVVLNDNKISIGPAVGAMSFYLSKLTSSSNYLSLRHKLKKLAKFLPFRLESLAKSLEKKARNINNMGNLFEDLGFFYIGPIDGHSLNDLVSVFSNIKKDQSITKPIFLHVITEKGKGFFSPQGISEKFHAVSKFDIKTGIQHSPKNSDLNFSEIFGDELTKQASIDPSIVAITAAMPSGTGLQKFLEKFPSRMFDVGIAEQHAVTFAAGLACENIKPFVAIYSTFLQRAYDQIIHDVAIQSLPVKFAIDRAGYVGADGPTHAGSFDIAFLSNLPNFILATPADELELREMIKLSLTINDRPFAFRYPRGIAISKDHAIQISYPIEIGKSRIIRQGSKYAVITLGPLLYEAIKAADNLINHSISLTLVDARFAKPIDQELMKIIAKTHQTLIIMEEGTSGGYGSHLLEFFVKENLHQNIEIITLHFPDEFLEHNTQSYMNEISGLSAQNIENIILKKENK